MLMNDIDLADYLSEDGVGWNEGAAGSHRHAGEPIPAVLTEAGLLSATYHHSAWDELHWFVVIPAGRGYQDVDLVAVDVTGAGSVGGL